jgi:O-methyltransferase involved in polyketide biosynthesis
LFIAEGLFPYFTEEEHRKIFTCSPNFPGQEMLFHTIAPSLMQELSRHSLMSRLSMKVEIQWGLDDSKQVSALHPKVEFVHEFSLLQEYYEQLPEPVRQKFSPAMAKQFAKIVHVRFHE